MISWGAFLENLDELRGKIDNIDNEILELISKRFALVKEIGNLKKAEGLEIYDPEREEKIAKRWKSEGRRYGLDSQMLMPILKSILGFSKYREEGQENRKSIVIIGTGSMAEALGLLAKNAGHTVYITGRNPEKVKSLSMLIGAKPLPVKGVAADYIVLCVPPNVLNKKLLRLVANCRCERLMDISSSKTEFFSRATKLASEAGMSIVSTHPLFGIEDAYAGSKIAIITDNCTTEEADEAARFWSSAGLVPVKMSMEEHEKAMAVSQVLRHAYALGFYDSVIELSKRLNVDYRSAVTAKFSQMLENAEAIKSEEWVADEIAESNPYSKIVYEIAERKLKEHASAKFLNLKE